MPLFDTPIVDPSVVKYVTMPGGLGGGGSVIVGRSYVVIDEAALADGAEVPIIAPADMKLVAFAHYTDPGQPTAAAQWVLEFEVSCEITITLAHINDVDPRIHAAADAAGIGTTTQTTSLREPVAFLEGEQIGVKVHQAEYGVDSFDFVLQNSNVENQFVNQERYTVPHPLEIVTEDCPYSYFTPAIRDMYLARMGTHGTGLIGPGVCRSVSRDVAGTVAGTWFWNEDPTFDMFAEREGNFPSSIAVIDDQGKYVAVGNLGPSIQQRRTFAGDPTYVLPENVTDRHCYQFQDREDGGFADFQMLSPTSVRVVYSHTGTCPVVFNGTDGRTYYR